MAQLSVAFSIHLLFALSAWKTRGDLSISGDLCSNPRAFATRLFTVSRTIADFIRGVDVRVLYWSAF